MKNLITKTPKKINIKEKINSFNNGKTFYENSFNDISHLLINYHNMKFSKAFIRSRAIKQFEDLNKNMILINRGIRRYSKKSLNQKINSLKTIMEICKKEERIIYLNTLEFAYTCKNLYNKLNTH